MRLKNAANLILEESKEGIEVAIVPHQENFFKIFKFVLVYEVQKVCIQAVIDFFRGYVSEEATIVLDKKDLREFVKNRQREHIRKMVEGKKEGFLELRDQALEDMRSWIEGEEVHLERIYNSKFVDEEVKKRIRDTLEIFGGKVKSIEKRKIFRDVSIQTTTRGSLNFFIGKETERKIVSSLKGSLVSKDKEEEKFFYDIAKSIYGMIFQTLITVGEAFGEADPKNFLIATAPKDISAAYDIVLNIKFKMNYKGKEKVFNEAFIGVHIKNLSEGSKKVGMSSGEIQYAVAQGQNVVKLIGNLVGKEKATEFYKHQKVKIGEKQKKKVTKVFGAKLIRHILEGKDKITDEDTIENITKILRISKERDLWVVLMGYEVHVGFSEGTKYIEKDKERKGYINFYNDKGKRIFYLTSKNKLKMSGSTKKEV